MAITPALSRERQLYTNTVLSLATVLNEYLGDMLPDKPLTRNTPYQAQWWTVPTTWICTTKSRTLPFGCTLPWSVMSPTFSRRTIHSGAPSSPAKAFHRLKTLNSRRKAS